MVWTRTRNELDKGAAESLEMETKQKVENGKALIILQQTTINGNGKKRSLAGKSVRQKELGGVNGKLKVLYKYTDK